MIYSFSRNVYLISHCFIYNFFNVKNLYVHIYIYIYIYKIKFIIYLITFIRIFIKLEYL